jgi:hypothetical protein
MTRSPTSIASWMRLGIIGPHAVSSAAYAALWPYADLFAIEGIGAAIRGPASWPLRWAAMPRPTHRRVNALHPDPPGRLEAARSSSREGAYVLQCVREATGGFEPPIAVLQTTALPLGYVAGGEG